MSSITSANVVNYDHNLHSKLKRPLPSYIYDRKTFIAQATAELWNSAAPIAASGLAAKNRLG